MASYILLNMVYNGKMICIQWLARKIGTNGSNLTIFVPFERRKSYLSIADKKKVVQQIDAKLDGNWNFAFKCSSLLFWARIVVLKGLFTFANN